MIKNADHIYTALNKFKTFWSSFFTWTHYVLLHRKDENEKLLNICAYPSNSCA